MDRPGAPPLPVTFRPRGARRVIYPVIALLLVAFFIGAVVLPPSYRLADRLAVVALSLAVAWFLHRLADVRIEADEGGLTVVNLFRRQRLAWAEVVSVRLRGAEPWVVLELADTEELPAMGIQGSDGEHARAQAGALARLVGELGSAPGRDT